jgi:hypothetical protein
MGERHHVDVLWPSADCAKDIEHRTAVDPAEREIHCRRAHSGIDQQQFAIKLDQQSTGAHQHLAARGEQLGPR